MGGWGFWVLGALYIIIDNGGWNVIAEERPTWTWHKIDMFIFNTVICTPG